MNYFEVSVHQILAELCPFENFCKLLVSSLLILQFTSDQTETCLIVRPWCGADAYCLEITVHQILAELLFPANSPYNLHQIKLKICS